MTEEKLDINQNVTFAPESMSFVDLTGEDDEPAVKKNVLNNLEIVDRISAVPSTSGKAPISASVMLVDLQQNPARQPRKSALCSSCDKNTQRNVHLPSCGHKFCYKCFIVILKSNQTMQDKCGIEGCNAFIPLNLIKIFLVPMDYIFFLEQTTIKLREALGIATQKEVQVRKNETFPTQVTGHVQLLMKRRHSELFRLQNLEGLPYVKSTEPFECPICFSDVGGGDGVILRNCLHSFCIACIIDTVNHCNDPQVPCPSQNCEFFIEAREVRGICPPEVYDKHISVGLKRAEAVMPNIFHCKTPDCVGFYQYEDAIAFSCEICDKVNCIRCEAIHEEKTCGQYQDDLKNDVKNLAEMKLTEEAVQKMLDNGKAMRCPQCDIIIQKSDGCDFVLCSKCKLGLCYRTKKPRNNFKKLVNGVQVVIEGCHCKEKAFGGKKCDPKCQNCH